MLIEGDAYLVRCGATLTCKHEQAATPRPADFSGTCRVSERAPKKTGHTKYAILSENSGSETEVRTWRMHIDHLKSLRPLQGLIITDVGAGDGVYSRELDAAGATVTAIEVDPIKVAKALTGLPRTIDVKLGAAEDLPLGDKSQDLVCLFFSLHHVPSNVQSEALEEFHRVLKPTGRLHIVEPHPYGTMFDVVRLVEDETEVRTNSHALLTGLDGRHGFQLVDMKQYVLTREYPTFEFFVDKIILPDPERRQAYEANSAYIEDTFNRVKESRDGRIVLHQPCTAYHFSLTQ